MCLIVLAWRTHRLSSDRCANRDEYFGGGCARRILDEHATSRRARSRAVDLVGITLDGDSPRSRLSKSRGQENRRASRGSLVSDFLTGKWLHWNTSGSRAACDELQRLQLLVGAASLCFFSNRGGPSSAWNRVFTPFEPSAGYALEIERVELLRESPLGSISPERIQQMVRKAEYRFHADDGAAAIGKKAERRASRREG